jgi:hypothetical protein
MKRIKILSILALLFATTFAFNAKAETFSSSMSVMNFLSSYSFKNSDGSITLQFNQYNIKANGQPITGAIIVDEVSSNSATFHAQNPHRQVTMHFQVYTDGTLYYVEGRETYKANINNTNNNHQPIGRSIN